MRRALPIAAAALVLAACGGSSGGGTGRTVTFDTAGAFPTLTIVGHYSAAGCAHDAGVIAESARLFYEHNTTLPGPADLYFYDMREAYAHFQADDCTSAQLGAGLDHELHGKQQRWLLANLPRDFRRVFRAAMSSA